MKTIDVVVPGISCDHCKRAIEAAVAVLDGVQRVDVDVPTKTVHVDYEERIVSAGAVRAAIEDEGYEVP